MKNGMIEGLFVLCAASLMIAHGSSLGRNRLQAAETETATSSQESSENAPRQIGVVIPAAIRAIAPSSDTPQAQKAEDLDLSATHRQTKILKLLETDKPAESATTSDEDVAHAEAEGAATVTPRAAAGRGNWQVKSFCLTRDDQLLVAVGGNEGELRLLSPEGKFLRAWPLPVVPEAINVDPSGNFLVAGQGQLYKLDPDGKVLLQKPSPIAAAIENNREVVRQQVIEQMKSTAQMMQQQRDRYAQVIDQTIDKATKNLSEDEQAELNILKRQVASHEDGDLDALSADDLNALNLRKVLIRMLRTKAEQTASATDSRRLELYRQQLVRMNQYIRTNGSGDPSDEVVDQALASMMDRKNQIASISEGAGDIFLATGAIKGYGYDVWRMNDQFEEPKTIVSGLRGCCGQMDVQGNQDGVFVAENSRHHVCHFDREGERVNQWGERARAGVRGFGGCCNPMNLAFGTDGSVYTAESTTGRIKRFSPDGQLQSLVGSVELVPGCKKVSIGVNSTGDRVYMLDITRNHIIVMSAYDRLGDPVKTAADEDLALDSNPSGE